MLDRQGLECTTELWLAQDHQREVTTTSIHVANSYAYIAVLYKCVSLCSK